LSAARQMLDRKIWAVVGVSADKSKFGYKVYVKLKKAGYTVYGINPKLNELEGEKVYKELSALPQKPEVVNFVVPAAVTLNMVPECAQNGIRYAWLQPGSESPAALDLLREHEMEVLQGCVLTELRKLR